MKLLDVKVNSNYEYNNSNAYRMDFYSKFIAANSSPGQFVHLECTKGKTPFLRRPISICDVDVRSSIVSICYAVVGEGTRLLSKIKPGEKISIIGPLGKGFKVFSGIKSYIVGGGIGIAPLLFLSRQLVESNNDVNIFYGAARRECLILEKDFRNQKKVRLDLATDDGSYGYKGMVTDLIEMEFEEEFKCGLNNAIIYSCGPLPMLKKVKELSIKYNLSCQLSLETKMACAIGACLGCAVKSIKLKDKDPSQKSSDVDFYFKACKDGPVFRADEVEL